MKNILLATLLLLSLTDFAQLQLDISSPLLGNSGCDMGCDFTSATTLSIQSAQADDGTTLGAASFKSTDFNSTVGGLISIDYQNAQLASATQNGFVSWTAPTQTFGGDKQFNGNVTFSGNATVSTSKILYLPNGLENAPALSFTSNTNGSGFSYTNGTNDKALSISINGSYGLEFLAGNDAGGATTYRQLNLTSGANFIDGIQHLNLNIVHLSYNNDQDGGISVSTYTNGDGHTCTFAGRSANGTESAPSQSVQYDRLAEFSGKGFYENGDEDDWDASNRGVYGIYASQAHTASAQGAYCAISTTANGDNENHISMVIDDKGNAGLTDQKFLTTNIPTGFGIAKTDRFFSIQTANDGKDAGLFIQTKNATKGLNIWLDNSASTTYFDNIENSSSAVLITRLMIASGTPFSAITTTTTGSTFKGYLVASALDAGLATTSTDGVVGTNTKASTNVIPVQYSPRIRLTGTAWNTTSSASQVADFIAEVRPMSGTAITSSLFFSSQINAAGYSDLFSLNNEGRIAIKAGTSTDLTAKVGGTIDVNTTATGNTGGSETTIYSKVIAGNTLSANGDRILCRAAGTYANTASNKRVKVKFGSTTIFDSGTLNITGAQTWSIVVVITRTGATTQKCTVTFISSDAALRASTSYFTTAETLSGNITFAVTGTGANNNDVVFEMGDIEWKPSN